MNRDAYILGYIEKSNMLEKVAFQHVGDGLGGVQLPSDSPGNIVNDLALGKSFVMPAVKPLTFADMPDVPKASTIDLLQTQRPVLGDDITAGLISSIDNSSDSRSGMLSVLDIAQGISRTLVGGAVGLGMANILGTIFSQPPAVKAKMANYGAIGGAILNSGLVDPLFKKGKDLLKR